MNLTYINVTVTGKVLRWKIYFLANALTVRLHIDYGYLSTPIDSLVRPIIHLKLFVWITLDRRPKMHMVTSIYLISFMPSPDGLSCSPPSRSCSIILVDLEAPKTFIPTRDLHFIMSSNSYACVESNILLPQRIQVRRTVSWSVLIKKYCDICMHYSLIVASTISGRSVTLPR